MVRTRGERGVWVWCSRCGGSGCDGGVGKGRVRGGGVSTWSGAVVVVVVVGDDCLVGVEARGVG